MVEFGGQYAREQFEDALGSLTGLRRVRWVLLGLAALLLVLSVLLDLFRPEPGWRLSLWVPALAGLVAVYLLLLRKVQQQTFDTSLFLRSPLRGSADEQGITLEAEHWSLRAPWSMFHRAVVQPRMVLLYQSTRVANFLPRDFFSSDADWAEFIRLVRTHAPRPQGHRWPFLLLIVVLALLLLAAAMFLIEVLRSGLRV